MRYFNGQFLQETDFQAEQAYHLDRQRRHNRTLHTSGIAQGLNVTADLGADDVQVASGTAIDEEGRMIVLENGSDPLSIRPEHHGKTVLLVISYDDEPSDPTKLGGNGETRIHEKPKLEFFVEGADPIPGTGTHIRLARLEITSGGTIGAHHTNVRVGAGVRLGDTLELGGLTLTRGGVDPNQWSKLSLGAPRRVDVDGNLRVSGSLAANDLATGLVSNSAIKDHVITINKLSTRRVVPRATTSIPAGRTIEIPVSDPIPITQAPPLTQVFVSAFSRTPDARFSWTQGSKTTVTPPITSQQCVFFRNDHPTVAIEVQYEIHVWTDDLA
jgi:hypothetical protein